VYSSVGAVLLQPTAKVPKVISTIATASKETMILFFIITSLNIALVTRLSNSEFF
jgi:hypothetical protein